MIPAYVNVGVFIEELLINAYYWSIVGGPILWVIWVIQKSKFGRIGTIRCKRCNHVGLPAKWGIFGVIPVCAKCHGKDWEEVQPRSP